MSKSVIHLYNLLPWLERMLVEGTTEYPEINDLDLLIDCKESITKSKLKELDKEINEKFKSVMFSSFRNRRY